MKQSDRIHFMHGLFIATMLTLFALVSSCSDETSAPSQPTFIGQWRVTYAPISGTEITGDSHALWDVAGTPSSVRGLIRYTDPNFVPCNCPTDSLQGAMTSPRVYRLLLGTTSFPRLIDDTTRIFVVDRTIELTIASTDGTFTGENRWRYTAASYLPAGKRIGDTYALWSVRALRSR